VVEARWKLTASASWPFTFPLLTAFSLAKSEKAEKQKSYSLSKGVGKLKNCTWGSYFFLVDFR
jgi:hypothetical protein